MSSKERGFRRETENYILGLSFSFGMISKDEIRLYSMLEEEMERQCDLYYIAMDLGRTGVAEAIVRATQLLGLAKRRLTHQAIDWRMFWK